MSDVRVPITCGDDLSRYDAQLRPLPFAVNATTYTFIGRRQCLSGVLTLDKECYIFISTSQPIKM